MMKRDMTTQARFRGKEGVTAVLVAIMIVMLLGFAALAVDIGYGMVTKNELQNVADAAALAASRQLGMIYQTMSYDQQQTYDADAGDEALIRQAAKDIALQNKAGGKNVIIEDSDIVIGTWNPSSTPALTPTASQPDAVRVRARRDSIANGAIATFFERVFGVTNLSVTALATAALTGQSTSPPGDLFFPVGISRYFFDTHSCSDTIQFNPSNSPDSCAGWTSWDLISNDPNLRDILTGTYSSPVTIANESVFNFIGGQLSNPTFDELLSLFQRKGYDVDANGDPITDGAGTPLHDATGTGLEVPLCEKSLATDCAVPCDATYTTQLYYPDGTQRNKHEWETGVVVYDSGDCANPNQSIKIVGFARVLMNNVCNAPYKLVRGIIECNYVDDSDSRGGGGSYGSIKGSIPQLVE